MGVRRDKIFTRFRAKAVLEQDKVLLDNSMQPISTDADLKEFLDINGAYMGLIWGLCELVARKKSERKVELQVEKEIYNEQIISLVFLG